MPPEEFERAVESDEPPTVTQLARRGTQSKPAPLLDIGDRDPADVKAATRGQGALRYLVDATTRARSENVIIEAMVRRLELMNGKLDKSNLNCLVQEESLRELTDSPYPSEFSFRTMLLCWPER